MASLDHTPLDPEDRYFFLGCVYMWSVVSVLVTFPLMQENTLAKATQGGNSLLGLTVPRDSPSWWESHGDKNLSPLVTLHPQEEARAMSAQFVFSICSVQNHNPRDDATHN